MANTTTTPILPTAAKDMAIVELRGQRFLLLGLGPAETPAPADTPQPASISPTPSPILKKGLAEANDTVTAAAKAKYVYGLQGLADLFGCSKSTAYNIKQSGKIDGAISQIGNTIVVDAEMALALAKK